MAPILQLGRRIAPLVLPHVAPAQPIDAAPLHSSDLKPWMDAARTFLMNTDFNVSSASRGLRLDHQALMDVMKQDSTGKRTIQALGDKILLHKLIENIGVPQMPTNPLASGPTFDSRAAEHFVRTQLRDLDDGEEMILKPTHMSNASGIIGVKRATPEMVESVVQTVMSHMRHFMGETAADHESAALRSLRPGFIAQPKYDPIEGMKGPLELRVIVLWGKARLGVWWWGRGEKPEEDASRNLWMVRRQVRKGELSDHDDWEPVHRHSGVDKCFDTGVELIKRHMSEVVAAAERVAVAVGAPFLRSDFFVGSSRWGVRLNEVAYGSGIDYVNLTADGSGRIVDDAPAIAQILQEGMFQCHMRHRSEHFLSKLGAKGQTYADMIVLPVGTEKIPVSHIKDRLQPPNGSRGHSVPPSELMGAVFPPRSRSFGSRPPAVYPQAVYPPRAYSFR